MEWIKTSDRLPEVIDVRIKLTDGSEINVWTQHDGDYWSELLQKFIDPSIVVEWSPIDDI
jgi:hypothetical protein